MFSDLIPTRIQGLDELIGGGLPKGTCILLLTEPMIEPRLFLLEYIYRGLENKEPGLIINLDELTNRLKDMALECNWFFEEKGEKEGILRWIDGYSFRGGKEIKVTSAVTLIADLNMISEFFIQVLKAQREIRENGKKDYYKFTFESLSTVIMHMNEIKAVYRFLERFIPRIREANCIGFFRMIKGMHSKEIEETMKHMMDGTIEIDENLNLKVLTLPTGTPQQQKNVKMIFRGKEGFKVEEVSK